MVVAALMVVAIAAFVLLRPSSPERPPVTTGSYQRHPSGVPDPETQLPDYALASPDIEELYRFALRRPDLLTYIPCTCGCGERAGHHSNWNCYIHSVSADGTVTFDDMAPG